MSHQVFISAAPRDRITANAVRAVLESRRHPLLGLPPRPAGRRRSGETAAAAIAAAQVMVLIFSASANEAEDQIKRELHFAAHSQTPVLPFRVENVKPVKALEYFLPANQFVDAFPPPLDGSSAPVGRHAQAGFGQSGAPCRPCWRWPHQNLRRHRRCRSPSRCMPRPDAGPLRAERRTR